MLILSFQALLKGFLLATAFKIHRNCTRCKSQKKPEFSIYNGFPGNGRLIQISLWFLVGNRCIDGVAFGQKDSIYMCFYTFIRDSTFGTFIRDSNFCTFIRDSTFCTFIRDSTFCTFIRDSTFVRLWETVPFVPLSETVPFVRLSETVPFLNTWPNTHVALPTRTVSNPVLLQCFIWMRFDMNLRRIDHFAVHSGGIGIWQSELEGDDSFLSIQIIQPTRCNTFTSLLIDVYVLLNMFRASPRPSSGAYNCISSLWFYWWTAAAGELLVVFWQTTTNNAVVQR